MIHSEVLYFFTCAFGCTSEFVAFVAFNCCDDTVRFRCCPIATIKLRITIFQTGFCELWTFLKVILPHNFGRSGLLHCTPTEVWPTSMWFVWCRKLADKTAAAGFYAVVPDYFRGDPYAPKDPANPWADFGPWIAKHHPVCFLSLYQTPLRVFLKRLRQLDS